MTANPKIRLPAVLVVAVVFAVVAASVADPNSQSSPAKAYYSVAGHAFGIGEEQVYVIARTSTLTVRYRDGSAALKSQTFKENARSSVAWTVEGIGSAGGPILGIATAAPVSTSSASPVPSIGPSTTPSASASPQASPMLDSQGAGAPTGALADLASASFLLSSLSADLPDIGKWWTSTGVVTLRYGTLTLHMNNIVNQPTGDQGSVVQISSTGGSDLQAKIKVTGFGLATLRGGGGATSQTFVESQNKLLLGMALNAFSHGNANVKGRTGSYNLNVSTTIKLVRYIPGIPVYSGSPGFLPASAYLGNTAPSDTAVYSTAVPDQVARPVATNTEFIPPATAPITPYPSTLPEVSLPPIPIPQSSDQPIASPPAPPTPTPTPTRYY